MRLELTLPSTRQGIKVVLGLPESGKRVLPRELLPFTTSLLPYKGTTHHATFNIHSEVTGQQDISAPSCRRAALAMRTQHTQQDR